MTEPDELLKSLLCVVEGDDTAAENKARADFIDLYCNGRGRGEMKMHDGGKVVFFSDRFEHAFFTSPNRARNCYSKSKLARDRIERMKWIGAMMKGEVDGVECWEVQPQSGRLHPRDRLLADWKAGYVIWLQPTKSGDGFKFSTAYPVPTSELARYTRGGRKIWTIKKVPRD